jgi:peptide deformylase
MLDIYTLGDDILNQRCKPIKTFDDALRILVDAMFETMDEASGIGLAAPQIGMDSRLFITNVPDDQKRVFINPQIVETSHDMATAEEGCLSIPGVWHDVKRPSRITVQAQDLTGKAFTLAADGLLARAIQHENDHLNGVLFIDRLEEIERAKMVRAYEKRSKRRVSV